MTNLNIYKYQILNIIKILNIKYQILNIIKMLNIKYQTSNIKYN